MSQKNTSARSAPCTRVRTPAVEALETRRLMAVTLDVTGRLGVTGTTGPDVVNISLDTTGGDRIVVNMNGGSRSFPMSRVRSIRVDAGRGDDAVEIDQGNGQVRQPATLLGGEGDDRLFGGGGNDNLQGQAGNDTLRGQGGRDFLRGSTGHDDLDGGTGDDRLDGNDGHDEMD